jgi:hypothetical protein
VGVRLDVEAVVGAFSLLDFCPVSRWKVYSCVTCEILGIVGGELI